jgi:SPP1 gp7 family putative phage head morphogenesis protein
MKHASLIRLRSRLAKTIAAFFRAQAPKIAAQIAAMRYRMGKADLSQDEIDAIEHALAAIDFAGWSVLVGEVDPILQEIVKDGSYAALASIHFDVTGSSGTAEVVSSDAVDYARDRSAELVGMRRDELGRLVENPDAEWAITEPTRDGLRQYVADAIEQGWSNDRLASEIRDSYAFSSERAMTIARTETNLASNQGSLNGYKASGVVDGKQWLTAEDDLVSEECEENGNAGPNGDGVLLDFDEEYPSGDTAPPAHPNCRCVLAPYIAATAETTTEETE